MGIHAAHRMHVNSLAAHATCDHGERAALVLGAYKDAGYAQTDRQIAVRLGFKDMNSVRPSITRLLDELKLREVGDIYDETTRKTVRLCQLP